MQKRLTNDTSIVEYEAEAEDRFSVWVSFAEIYNENIFDLLQPVVINQRRKALKLARDNHSNTYIKGSVFWSLWSFLVYLKMFVNKQNIQIIWTTNKGENFELIYMDIDFGINVNASSNQFHILNINPLKVFKWNRQAFLSLVLILNLIWLRIKQIHGYIWSKKSTRAQCGASIPQNGKAHESCCWFSWPVQLPQFLIIYFGLNYCDISFLSHINCCFTQLSVSTQ